MEELGFQAAPNQELKPDDISVHRSTGLPYY